MGKGGVPELAFQALTGQREQLRWQREGAQWRPGLSEGFWGSGSRTLRVSALGVKSGTRLRLIRQAQPNKQKFPIPEVPKPSEAVEAASLQDAHLVKVARERSCAGDHQPDSSSRAVLLAPGILRAGELPAGCLHLQSRDERTTPG